MGYKGFLSGIAAGTVVAAAALVAVVLGLNPDKGVWSYIAFFGSILFFLIGLLTLVGFYGRIILKRTEQLYANVPTAFRQAVLLSIFLTTVLILKSFNILAFWDAILLFFSIMLLEFYFRSRISS